mgnify:CR=1 FL=1
MKNKEIKQIFFSKKKNKKEKKGKGRKKWIIVALVLVLTLGGGSVAAVTAAVCRVVPAGEWISADFSDSDRRKRAKP